MVKIIDENNIITISQLENNKVQIYSDKGFSDTNFTTDTLLFDKIILCGKMASGKDYMRALLVNDNFTKDISYTSRQMRKGEVDGQDYNFISEQQFKEMIANDEFFEYTCFCGWYYGTTKENWNAKQIFIFDPCGLKKVKQSVILENICVIYLDVPLSKRYERLKDRDMGYDSIERRIFSDYELFQNIYYNLKLTDPLIKII